MNLWTDEQNAMLTKLYAAGLSFSMIVDAINGHFGTTFSRNAAIGRVHRMDLPPRSSPIARGPSVIIDTPKVTREDRLRVAPGAQVQAINRGHKINGDGYTPKSVDVATLDIRLVDLEPAQCRFACVRVDNEWRFCGHPKKDGSSYCSDHHALIWTPRKAPVIQLPHFRAKRRAA